jgi:hypothetical protein
MSCTFIRPSSLAKFVITTSRFDCSIIWWVRVRCDAFCGCHLAVDSSGLEGFAFSTENKMSLSSHPHPLIPFDHRHYVAVLRCKQAEKGALKQLPESVRASMTL